jgi:hypothetical protein
MNVALFQMALQFPGPPVVWPSAFRSGRLKINREAFRSLFRAGVDIGLSSDKMKRLKGFRLFGVDGALARVESALEADFGGSAKPGDPSGQPTGRASFLVDLLNEGFIVDAVFGKFTDGERKCAPRRLAFPALAKVAQVCVMYDRGYIGIELLEAHIKNGFQFIFRAPRGWPDFDELGEGGRIVWLRGPKRGFFQARAAKRSMGGELFTLVCGMGLSAFSCEELKSLYRERWVCETKYKSVKSNL